jgi:predicted transposase YbfD/YdcC
MKPTFDQQTYSYSWESVQTNNHGRIESREHWLMEVPEYLKRATKYWTKLQTIAMVRRTRLVGDKSSEETHYDISSLPLSAGSKSIAKAIRSHWAVENKLHWSLDVAFREDASQVRKDEGPANLACVRRLALTQLKRETS